ncbi:MAG: FAD-dependent oxidoreductase [Janthinobacterium lividum]
MLQRRTPAAALGLRTRPVGDRSLLVLGGIIGLEIAASATSRGCSVTLVDVAPRVVTPELSAALRLGTWSHPGRRGTGVCAGWPAAAQVSVKAIAEGQSEHESAFGAVAMVRLAHEPIPFRVDHGL